MSKSYKKEPIVKDHTSGAYGKRLANHAVRKNLDDIPNGKAYRRYFNSYNVHDYISRYTWEDQVRHNKSVEKAGINDGLSFNSYRFSKPKDYNEWARIFIRK